MNNEVRKIKEKIAPILKEYNVTKAGIFGSYARGEQKANSDVDILVETDNNMTMIEFIGLKNELERVFKKKVDLVEYSTIRKEFKNQVLKEEISIIWIEIISSTLTI